jgi:hypothetical protein
VGGGGCRGGERGWEAAARKRGFSIFDFREKGRCIRAAVEEEGFLFGVIFHYLDSAIIHLFGDELFNFSFSF